MVIEDLDLLAVDRDEVVAGGDVVLEVAEDGVVLQQVGQCGGGGEIVNGYEFDVRVAESGAEDVAADAAEAVDTNFNCHNLLAPQELRASCDADAGNCFRLSLFGGYQTEMSRANFRLLLVTVCGPTGLRTRNPLCYKLTRRCVDCEHTACDF
jgi:hypothetical protein